MHAARTAEVPGIFYSVIPSGVVLLPEVLFANKRRNSVLFFTVTLK